MADQVSYIIEVEGEPVGIVVTDDNRMTFHAVHPRTADLNGRRFIDTIDAMRAASAVMRKAA